VLSASCISKVTRFASLIHRFPLIGLIEPVFACPTRERPAKILADEPPDLQILRASLIITGLLVQRIAICCLRYGVQNFVIEELHG
jgi:hypothetical protein